MFNGTFDYKLDIINLCRVHIVNEFSIELFIKPAVNPNISWLFIYFKQMQVNIYFVKKSDIVFHSTQRGRR